MRVIFEVSNKFDLRLSPFQTCKHPTEIICDICKRLWPELQLRKTSLQKTPSSRLDAVLTTLFL